MKIPGVGMGSPGDPEWQKVGELCMGPVKSVWLKANLKA